MTRQLTLIEERPSWRLDERTREVGRRGLAEARASLRAALAARQRAEAAAERSPSPGRSAA